MKTRFQDGHPAYLRLYTLLREEILRGERQRGEKLPSRRELAKDHGLSVITVEHSLDLLIQEGYVETRPRSGYYVIYRETDGFARTSEKERTEEAAQREAAPESPAGEPGEPPEPAGTGETAWNGAGEQKEETFPFSALARTMRRVLTERGEDILKKTDNQGAPELRDAISRYLGRNREIHVNPRQILVGSGAEYLYGLVVELLGRERMFAIESPSYAKIRQVYEAKGVRCDQLPLGRHGIRSEALQRTEASVLHITPFRSFPSGVTATASKRREYLQWAEGEDRYIVEDDFESEFSLLRKPEETVFGRSSRENVIYLNTFSRTLSPSFRIGYMVLPERLIPLCQERVGFYSCTVPAFEQFVLAELLNSGDFERHINRIRRAKRRRESARDGQTARRTTGKPGEQPEKSARKVPGKARKSPEKPGKAGKNGKKG